MLMKLTLIVEHMLEILLKSIFGNKMEVLRK